MKKFFCDNEGKPSLMRLLSTVLFIYWMGFSLVLVKVGQTELIPQLSLIFLGFVFGGKLGQKVAESVKKDN